MPIEPATGKWQVITMGFITPLPRTKKSNSGILKVVDKLSKMIRLIPVTHDIDAPGAALKLKEHVYRNHGITEKIISDRDTIFMSKFWKTLFKSLGTKLAPSSAYHPQTDRQSEIMNRKAEEVIRAFSNYRKNDWEEHLVDFEAAYNSAVNSTTLCPPFFMNYGIHPRTVPVEVWNTKNPSVNEFLSDIEDITNFVHDIIEIQNKKTAEYANQSRIDHDFCVGDKVWLSTKNLKLEDGSGSRKLNPRFCGPFNIMEKINDVTIRLDLPEPMKAKRIHDAFHVSLLKPFIEDYYGRYDEPQPPVQLDDAEEEYEVEAILDEKNIKGKKHYLVKWKGYAITKTHGKQKRI